MQTITSVEDCTAAAQSLGYLAQDDDGVFAEVFTSMRSKGCSLDPSGNTKFFANSSYPDMSCTHFSYGGCMCRS